jgi:hypothetical protein
MPEPNAGRLLWLAWNTGRVALGYFITRHTKRNNAGVTWQWVNAGGLPIFHPQGITHWMPVDVPPPPPTGRLVKEPL